MKTIINLRCESQPFLAIASALCCIAAAEAAVDIKLTSKSEFEVFARPGGGSTLGISELPMFDQVLVASSGEEAPISRVTVNIFDKGAGTIFRIDYDEQFADAVSTSATAAGTVFFTVDQPTPYEVTGSYSGVAKRPGATFRNTSGLVRALGSENIYLETDASTTLTAEELVEFSFNHSPEGNRRSEARLDGERTGILQSGDHIFLTFSGAVDGSGSGFVQLVLGDPTAPVFGDFNDDGMLGTLDIDLLSEAVRDSSDDLAFDLSDNGIVDADDRRIWVEDAFGTLFGDASLDKEVSFIDFTSLSFFFGKAGGWEQGDFDGNGFVQFPDFLLLSNNFGKSAASVAAVPEASGAFVMILGAAILFATRRQTTR